MTCEDLLLAVNGEAEERGEKVFGGREKRAGLNVRALGWCVGWE